MQKEFNYQEFSGVMRSEIKELIKLGLKFDYTVEATTTPTLSIDLLTMRPNVRYFFNTENNTLDADLSKTYLAQTIQFKDKQELVDTINENSESTLVLLIMINTEKNSIYWDNRIRVSFLKR